MPTATINETNLFYEVSGRGDSAVVLVHGSWSSHHTWDAIVPLLAERYRVVTYDRRGHSESERPPGQGSIREDVADLAGVIEHLDLAPAWAVGNSQGGLIALRLAGTRPELLRGVIAHEPPLFDLAAHDARAAQALRVTKEWETAVLRHIAAGECAAGAELFMEMVVGPGSWSRLPADYQEVLAYNAPTFLDEKQDPENVAFDPAWVHSFPGPVLLTTGSQSDPIFAAIFARLPSLLPGAVVRTLPGAGHVPQRYEGGAYVEMLQNFIERETEERTVPAPRRISAAEGKGELTDD